MAKKTFDSASDTAVGNAPSTRRGVKCQAPGCTNPNDETFYIGKPTIPYPFACAACFERLGKKPGPKLRLASFAERTGQTTPKSSND